MIDILGEIIGAIGEAIFSWRFYLCFGIAIILIATIHWFVPVSTCRHVVSGAVGVLPWPGRSFGSIVQHDPWHGATVRL